MVKIIFQNDDFVVIEKPAGLAVHRGVGTEGKTLVDFLVEKFPEIRKVGDAQPRTITQGGISAWDPESRPGIVHRLDKETSGVMLISRNQKSFERLKNLFKNREVEKKYIALVHGVPKDAEGKIEGEMGRSKRDFRKQTLVKGKARVRKERYSLTYYRVLRKFKKYSLLEVFPKTGRTHQIRVHLHSIGHPIVGDKKYTFKPYKKEICARMFLHARGISFPGADGKLLNFESPMPAEFGEFERNLDPAPIPESS